MHTHKKSKGNGESDAAAGKDQRNASHTRTVLDSTSRLETERSRNSLSHLAATSDLETLEAVGERLSDNFKCTATCRHKGSQINCLLAAAMDNAGLTKQLASMICSSRAKSTFSSTPRTG